MNTISRFVAMGLLMATSLGVYAGTGNGADKAIAEAQAAYDKVDAVHGAWINTGKLLKKARAAAAKGDESKAMKLAAKAKREADLSYAQAMDQRKHWSVPPYLKP